MVCRRLIWLEAHRRLEGPILRISIEAGRECLEDPWALPKALRARVHELVLAPSALALGPEILLSRLSGFPGLSSIVLHPSRGSHVLLDTMRVLRASIPAAFPGLVAYTENGGSPCFPRPELCRLPALTALRLDRVRLAGPSSPLAPSWGARLSSVSLSGLRLDFWLACASAAGQQPLDGLSTLPYLRSLTLRAEEPLELPLAAALLPQGLTELVLSNIFLDASLAAPPPCLSRLELALPTSDRPPALCVDRCTSLTSLSLSVAPGWPLPPDWPSSCLRVAAERLRQLSLGAIQPEPEVLQKATRLTRLEVHGAGPRPPISLPLLPRLVHLCLRSLSLPSAATLELLPRLSRLSSLDLARSQWIACLQQTAPGDSLAEALWHLTGLRALNLGGWAMTGEAVYALLGALSGLESLHCPRLVRGRKVPPHGHRLLERAWAPAG